MIAWTGIPVSVGIARTKTLAKLANRVAKKSTKADGVVDLSNRQDLIDTALNRVEVGDVWGVGRRYAERLAGYGIRTAHDLSIRGEQWARYEFGIVLARTVSELRGKPVFTLEDQPAPRQSCTCSRSFGLSTPDIEAVAAAISEYAQTAAERLRGEGMVAGHIQVFAYTNRFRKDAIQGVLAASSPLSPPTADTVQIVRTALKLTRVTKNYPPGCEWSKAGVLLTDLCRVDHVEQDLFTRVDSYKSEMLMTAIDHVNARYGRRCVGFGLSAEQADWRMRREKLSPAWTTRWTDIPTVKV